MHKLELRIDGQSYGGWKSVRIQRSIEQLAGTFELSVSERWPGQISPRPIHVGDACEITIEDQPVITGHVDDVSMSYDARSHDVTVRGRDAAGDLVDCSLQYRQFTSPQKLEQIAKVICDPFKIAIKTAIDTGARYQYFAIDHGEAAVEALARLARGRGVLMVSDGVGGITITRAGPLRVRTPLVHGVNILDATHDISIREWFREYTVSGSRQGDAETVFANEEAKTVIDESTPRDYRPLIIIAETQGDMGLYQRRAEWERNTRRGRASRVSITVHGWAHADGLWQPNQLVSVRDKWLALDGELLIVSVVFVLDIFSGTRTELTLTPPAAFDLLPLPKEDNAWYALG